MLRSLKKLFSVLVLCFSVLYSSSQEDSLTLEIEATTIDVFTKSKLANVAIKIYEKKADGTLEEYASTVTEKKGFFSTGLLLQKEYIISATKRGYLPKKFLIDTKMNEADLDFFTHGMTLLMTQKIMTEEDSLAMLNKPVARLYYSQRTKSFTNDILYSINLKKEASSIPPDIAERLKKNTEEKLAATDVEKEKELDKKIQADLTRATKKIEEFKDPNLKARQDSIDASIRKAREDSIKNAIEMSDKRMAAEKEKARLDSLAAIAVKKVEKKDTVVTNLPTIKDIAAKKILINTKSLENKAEEVLLLNKVIVSELRTTEEIEKNISFVEERVVKKEIELKQEKKKQENLSTKYETGNPLTSLLDVIDEYQKQNKNTIK